MAWPNIDPTSPQPTDKVKFGDDVIRMFKSNVITALQKICNFQDNGGSVAGLKTAVWTTAGRPSGSDLVDKVTGYNSDFSCEEYYDLATSKWVTKGIPFWTVAARPSSPYTGQYGYNTELAAIEKYNGSAWTRMLGGRRGDIKMWSGAVSDIETGWVLADGVQRVHPEGGNYTPPDLRNRFIVGAGQDGGTHTPGADGVGTGYYAPGAAGGEDKHTLAAIEEAPHTHPYLTANDKNGFPDAWTDSNSGSAYWRYGDKTINTTTNTGGQAHENRPPYYALCYLYKI